MTLSLPFSSHKEMAHKVPFIYDSDLEEQADDASKDVSVTYTISESSEDNIIISTFRDSRSQWIDDPIISQWREPSHKIYSVLSEVNNLYKSWKSRLPRPFSPSTDALWISTAQFVAEAGLPWHSNQINMPGEIDTSWPFHFKSFETDVIKAKGARVGDANATGYVCNLDEANLYCIRALQQELREKCSTLRPLLLYDHFEEGILKSAETIFGLEFHRVSLSRSKKEIYEILLKLTRKGHRAVIFAAILANNHGECDDLNFICEISESFPLILHIDASRNFDYITTMSDSERRRLGIERLKLGVKPVDQPLRSHDGSIVVSTISAGGANHTSPAPVVALKPARLGSTHGRVAYTRASDSTLAGSRDALAPLMVALQEIRFGELGFRDIYEHCSSMRNILLCALQSQGLEAVAPAYSLDIIVKDCSNKEIAVLSGFGGVSTGNSVVLLTIQPSVTELNIETLIASLSSATQYQISETKPKLNRDFSMIYSIPQSLVYELKNTVQSWKVATRSAAGYPFHMGSYSALGPVIGRFLELEMPNDWIHSKGHEILATRMKMFGLAEPRQRADFTGTFTNGSTMGNRVGIHTALSHFPDAHVYFSAESHYSVAKTLRDCDALTNRWSDRGPRFSQIPQNADGSMLVEALMRKALIDREQCWQLREEYRMILFANMGTTFAGARDNLRRIRQSLAGVGIEISYIHMDGALNFGFNNCGITLGPPATEDANGMPAVQGVTLSHHKAMGNMVSGEVICYRPSNHLATLGSSVDPRAIFETWLYGLVYSSHDMAVMFRHCQANAEHLESGLRRLGVVTKRNPGSIITVLERPPAWIIEEFSLRPEGGWVHFIIMPHISRETVDLFIDRIASVDRQCHIAFCYVTPLLSAVMERSTGLRRVQCQQPMATRIARIHKFLIVADRGEIGATIEASLGSALTVVVVDEQDQLQAVFLAESTRDRSVRYGPILLSSKYCHLDNLILDVARQLMGFMARHMDAKLRTDDRRDRVYWF
ncbi:pyridoxal phosphate-dependent transferase [Pseudomassariella vexata]|uniref:Pyridoxal phosphate-dependent transferase n=1 Tax=Pseudomassariella vexata TaxID=1141098 RepID=A0A1Y2DLE5_9PEZI|nr:pyridoxal phosphate-dependent transferase [Pseudomassariella vexata]ORY60062.1 pyridoxal phosphate-dependent transferase [Pseudomassariella vexata]